MTYTPTHPPRLRAAGFFLTVLFAMGCAVGLSAWDVYRGNPALNGVSASDFSVRPAVQWQAALDSEPVGGIILDDSRVWITDATGVLHARNRTDGAPLWTYRAEAPFSAPPMKQGNRILAGDDQGILHAVDAADGRLIWRFTTGAKITASAVPGPDGMALVGSYDHVLYAIDVETGTMRWQILTDAQVHAAASVQGNAAVVAGCDGMIRVLDARTGTPRKVLDGGGSFAAHAVLCGNMIFAGSMHARYQAFHALDGTPIPLPVDSDAPCHQGPAVSRDEIVFVTRDGTVFCIDRDSLSLRWRRKPGAAVEGEPILAGSVIILADMMGEIHALDRQTGVTLWRFSAGSAIRLPLSAFGNMLMAATEDGTLLSLRFGTE